MEKMKTNTHTPNKRSKCNANQQIDQLRLYLLHSSTLQHTSENKTNKKQDENENKLKNKSTIGVFPLGWISFYPHIGKRRGLKSENFDRQIKYYLW